MEENNFKGPREEPVYTVKMRAGRKRTYFLDVRETKGNDFYITLTESKKRMDGGYDRHKIFIYKEDFNKFMESMNEVVNHVKTELMPNYDYDESARKQEEYEKQRAEQDAEQANNPTSDSGEVGTNNKSVTEDTNNKSVTEESEKPSSSAGSYNPGNQDDEKLIQDKPISNDNSSSAPAGNDDDLKW